MSETSETESDRELTRPFHWDEVPAERGQPTDPTLPGRREPRFAPSLGDISQFAGTFTGRGFNTIFRPHFADPENPVDNPDNEPDDNVLELNVTSETLTFFGALGTVPNRSLLGKNIFLNGVPYIQQITDVTGPGAPVPIHFEPGVWLTVPHSDVPDEDPSIVRLASIPHGTTIVAQGKSFAAPNGTPVFRTLDITPSVPGQPPFTPDQNPFLSQTQPQRDSIFRIPQKLGDLIAAGTITPAMIADPNSVLRDRANAQQISGTIVIDVTTAPDAPLFGGGTSNIAFLLGDAAAADPNADATTMTAIFWIETVTEDIVVPGGTQPGVLTVPGSTATGEPTVTFAVQIDEPVLEDTPLHPTYTQIQYTQTVILKFKGLNWPHASVATLVPLGDIPWSIPQG